MAALHVGAGARTLVPDSAVAELDLRLVPDIDPDRQVERLRAHLRKHGYHLVDASPDAATRAAHPKLARVVGRQGGYRATRTPADHPVAARVVDAVRASSSQPPVLIPMLGGSIPAAWFPEILGTPVILIPLVNPDNNQHAENENLRLGNLFDGVKLLAGVLAYRPER
jgi:acetylornithine deacetylase/succinyl-diaminopimelate desuccinylase-like protein